jgi:hypothetical protein
LSPFSLADDPGYPLRVHIDYPARIDNWRPLVQWLLAIPYLIVAGVLYWLTGVLWVVAFFAVLFTKQIPPGSVRADGPRAALESPRQRLRVVHDRSLSPVCLGIAAPLPGKQNQPPAA